MLRTRRNRGEHRGMTGLMALVALVGLLEARPIHAQGPVKIGFIYPDTGAFAQAGLDMRDGFLLYWSEVGNKAGGRPVELFPEGKASLRPDEAVTKARKLVERDGVHIIGGILETADAYALRSYLIEKKMIVMLMGTGAIDLTQKHRSEYIFRSAFTSNDSSHPLGDWAYKQGYRKAVLMASDLVVGHEMMGSFARTFTDLGGRIIQEIYPPPAVPDFAPYLAQLRRDADVVSAFFGGSDAIRFVNQYTEFGLKEKIPLIGKGFVTDESILPRMGDNALGIVTGHQWSAALDTPTNKRFLEAYMAKYRRPASGYAEATYLGSQMIAQALETVRGAIENREAFLAALKKVEVDAPRGKVKLDAYQNVVHPIYIRRVEKKDGILQNAVIATYPNTTQFWKWTPEEYMAMPPYPEMKGKWAK